MKKLTAGIFATILGLTAVDAFAAVPTGMTKVATTNYVDGALGAAKSYTDSAVANKADKSTTYTKNEVNELVGNVNTSLEGYVKTQIYNTDQSNQNTAIQAAQKTATDAASAASAAADAAAAADGKAQAAANAAAAADAKASAAADAAATADAKAVAADGKAVAAQNDVDVLEGKVGTVPEGKTVVKMIEDAQSEATYDDKDVKNRLTAIEAEQEVQNTDIEALKSGKADASELKKYVLWDDVENVYPTQKPQQ